MHYPDNPERAQEANGENAASSPRVSPPDFNADSIDAAEMERRSADWEGIAAMPAFRELLASKARFIIAGTVFFLVYYFALPVLVGWFPELMERKVGEVNIAYLFALSQFFMAWAVAAVYVKVAAGWDRRAQAIIETSERK